MKTEKPSTAAGQAARGPMPDATTTEANPRKAARSSAQTASSGGLRALWRRAPLDWGIDRRRERPACVLAPYREITRGGRDGRSRVLQLPGEQAAVPKKKAHGAA